MAARTRGRNPSDRETRSGLGTAVDRVLDLLVAQVGGAGGLRLRVRQPGVEDVAVAEVDAVAAEEMVIPAEMLPRLDVPRRRAGGGLSARPHLSVRTERDGRFHFTWIEAGAWELRVAAQDFVPLRTAAVARPGATEERDLVLSVIMTVASRPEEVSANLCAPLIFNLANRRAMQYVLNDQRYPVKYFVFKGVAAGAPAPSPSNSGERLDPRSLSLR